MKLDKNWAVIETQWTSVTERSRKWEGDWFLTVEKHTSNKRDQERWERENIREEMS